MIKQRQAKYTYQPNCIQCGKQFPAARDTAKYCSDSCRQTALYDKNHMDDRFSTAYDFIEAIGKTGLNHASESQKAMKGLRVLETLIKEWQAKIYTAHH